MPALEQVSVMNDLKGSEGMQKQRKSNQETVVQSLKLCLTLCNPMDCSVPGSSVLHYPPGLFKLMSIELVILSNHLIFCHPLLLLPSIFPSIRVFSNELALLIRWLNY